MKKKIIIVMVIVVLLILLVPIPMHLNDGGTVEYKALTYKISKVHRLTGNLEKEYEDGTIIEILGVEIINTTNKKEEVLTLTKEKIKLKDIKFINIEGINTNKLVKFNDVLYGKSYSVIDYAGDFNKTIGTIDFLIGEEYMPELNGETNCEELLNSSVLEVNNKSMVLNVNNEAVLFNAIDKTNIKKANGDSLYENNEKSNRSTEKVTIQVDNKSLNSESILITITDNNKEHYGWGVEFRVQEKVNGEWKDLQYISDNLSWIDIAYELNADNQLTQKLDIEKYYGKLNSGTYRIVKPVYDNGYIDIYSDEFEIK